MNVCYFNPDAKSQTILSHNRSNNPQAQRILHLMELGEASSPSGRTPGATKSHYVHTNVDDKLTSSQNRKTTKKYHCRTRSHPFQLEEPLKKHEERGLSRSGRTTITPASTPNSKKSKTGLYSQKKACLLHARCEIV